MSTKRSRIIIWHDPRTPKGIPSQLRIGFEQLMGRAQGDGAPYSLRGDRMNALCGRLSLTLFARIRRSIASCLSLTPHLFFLFLLPSRFV
jgi:hypothetical protein